MTMKAIVRPVCAGCGYRYDPRRKIRVLDFVCDDGDYIACEKCLEKVGMLKDRGREDEIGALIKTFMAV